MAVPCDAKQMSFFDDFPRPKARRVRPPKRQPWQGSEPGWIGGWVPWRVVLIKTDDAYAMLREFEAYPTGLQFSMVTTFRPEPTPPASGVEEMMHARMMMMRGRNGPRFGVMFSDGRKTAVDEGFPIGSRDREPDRPVLVHQGGGGGGGVWRQGFWLWPLPPPGPLTWVASWEERGIAETSVVVDASVLLEAAAEAEKLWDVPEGVAYGPSSSSSAVLMASGSKKGSKESKKKSKK